MFELNSAGFACFSFKFCSLEFWLLAFELKFDPSASNFRSLFELPSKFELLVSNLPPFRPSSMILASFCGFARFGWFCLLVFQILIA